MRRHNVYNLDTLIKQLWDYEPNIVRRIYYLMFVRCDKYLISDFKKYKSRLIHLLPEPNTKSICSGKTHTAYINVIILDNSITH